MQFVKSLFTFRLLAILAKIASSAASSSNMVPRFLKCLVGPLFGSSPSLTEYCALTLVDFASVCQIARGTSSKCTKIS